MGNCFPTPDEYNRSADLLKNGIEKLFNRRPESAALGYYKLFRTNFEELRGLPHTTVAQKMWAMKAARKAR